MLDFYTILNQITNETLSAWASEIVADLKQSHIDAGQVASGKTLEEFGYRIEQNEGSIILKIEGAEHIEFDDRGRGTGKQSPVESIEQWIKDKGLQSKWNLSNKQTLSTAYAIAKKHANEGSYQHRTGKTWNGKTKPVSSVFTEQKTKKLNDKLTGVILSRMESEIIEQFKKAV